MPKYQVTAGVISAPTDAFYQGTEVTAEGMGIPQDRFDALVTQGVIGEVKEDKATEPIADGAPASAGRGTQIAGGEAAPSATALPVAVVPSLPLVPREEDAIETKTIKKS